MPVSRPAIALALALLAGPSALAADKPPPQATRPAEPAHPAHPAHSAHPGRIFHVIHPRACLTRAEQRAAVAEKRAISLAAAIRSLRAHGKRAEVVRARLCRRGEKMVYLLTLLGRSGKVFRITVDAGSGELISSR
jgi:hypothetical protein